MAASSTSRRISPDTTYCHGGIDIPAHKLVRYARANNIHVQLSNMYFTLVDFLKLLGYPYLFPLRPKDRHWFIPNIVGIIRRTMECNPEAKTARTVFISLKKLMDPVALSNEASIFDLGIGMYLTYNLILLPLGCGVLMLRVRKKTVQAYRMVRIPSSGYQMSSAYIGEYR